jgi:hypothetical protein
VHCCTYSALYPAVRSLYSGASVPAERRPFQPLQRAGLLLLTAVSLSVGVHAAAASTRAAAADPNTLGKGSADAVSVVRWVGAGTYQLDVQNTSGIGYINQFTWVPPANLTVTAVTSSEGGKCTLVGGSIQCNGKVAPPSCTCLAGGDLTVTFTAKGLDPTFANGYWTYYGIVGAYLQIQQMTPVPYHIPSVLPKLGLDLPLCKKGQTSTKARPCV